MEYYNSLCPYNQNDMIEIIRPDFDKLNIDPCIPKEWDKFKVHRVWRGAEYDINVVNPNKVNKGVKEIKLNGEIVDFIPVMEKGSHNLVEITMG